MKKFLVISSLSIAMLMAGITVNAQVRFGIRGEVGINKPSFNADVVKVENLNSYKVGPTVEFMFPADTWGIEAAVLYNNNRMNVNREKSLVQEVENHYIDIPVNLKYKFGLFLPVKVYLAAGPYIQVLVDSEVITDSSDFFDGFTDNLSSKNFEAGLNGGFGLEILRKIAVGAVYNVNLTDNYSVKKPEWNDAFNKKKGEWALTATFYF